MADLAYDAVRRMSRRRFLTTTALGTAKAGFAVAVAQDLQTSTTGLAATSSVRSVAAAAITGLTQVAVAAGATEGQLTTLAQAATTTLASAPVVDIGSVVPDNQGSGTNAG